MLDIVFSSDQEGTKAVFARWLVAVGDLVSTNDPVAEVETDKVMVEIAAPGDGRVVSLDLSEGDAVEPGMVVGQLDETDTSGASAIESSSDTVSEVARTAATAASGSTEMARRLSPAVRRLVTENDLEASQIPGTGRGGRITVGDVKRYQASPPKPIAKAEAKAPVADMQAFASHDVPHDQMRKRIAEHMVTSLLHTAPHVTSVFEVDLSGVLAHRKAHKADYADKGVGLTITAYIVDACIKALQAVPEVNSRFHEDHLQVFDDINIGVGTALGDKGLVVPVLHQAQGKDLFDIASMLTDLTSRARGGQLQPADVRHGTFTISNHGVSGSLFATPIIINQPQSAILGVGKLEKRVKVVSVDGEEVIKILPMCYISLTIDHRALDAHQTNEFLSVVVTELENWQTR